MSVRDAIASHVPEACDPCVDFRDRRWRVVGTKSWAETEYRNGLVRHVVFFAGKARGSRVSWPRDHAVMDEFVGRGERRARTSGRTEVVNHLDLPAELVLADGAGSDAIPELVIPEDTDVPADHDETTCPVCAFWARASVYALQNIGNLEEKWVDRDADDHIAPGATDEQRDYWRESFEHTSRVIRHVRTVRPKGEDALAWHARVLRAVAADDRVAMHNVEYFEFERDRRRRKVALDTARRAYPERFRHGPTTYPDGVIALGSGEDPTRNRLLVMWLRSYGLDWAEGTRFAENLPVELMRRVPAFMRKR